MLDKKQFGYILALILLISTVGGLYYFLLDDHDYYTAYKSQAVANNQALELTMQTITPLLGGMMAGKSSLMSSMLNQASQNNDQNYVEADRQANRALKYQKEMLKVAKTPSQRRYAELLIKQSECLIKYLKTAQEYNRMHNDAEAVKAFQEFSTTSQGIQKDLLLVLRDDAALRKRVHGIDKALAEEQ